MTEPIVDIDALASLARLAISEHEKIALQKEIPNILAFVDTIQRVETPASVHTPSLHNVLREDTDPRPSGEYTERLMQGAPAVAHNRVVVKQVVSRDK